MAYEKQGFVDGMILKAEHLVKIEEGIIEAEESVESSVQDALEEAKESGEFDGKSAYQYAQEGGFTGTEATFAERLARGNIHIGTDAPADGSEVWIDTDEEPTSEEPTSGGSIDVTAEVGQTIIVKEVDENGKPTKWESADYQPRTHWTEEAVILPETAVEVDAEMGAAFLPEFTLTDGAEYAVNYNGTEFACVCVGDIGLGNFGALDENMTDTGEPFVILYESETWFCLPLDGSTSVTLSIVGEVITKIPHKYIETEAINQYIDEKAEELINNAEDIARSVVNNTQIIDLSDIFGVAFDLSSGSYSEAITGDGAKLVNSAMSSCYYYSKPNKIIAKFQLTYDGITADYFALLQIHQGGNLFCGSTMVVLKQWSLLEFNKSATVFIRTFLDTSNVFHCAVKIITNDL